MGFIHAAVAVLSLLSVGQSAPVTSCESLIQPLEITGREQLLGKWIKVAESTNSQVANCLLKAFQNSFWMKITAANKSDAVIVTGSTKAFGTCGTVAFKATLENNTLQASVMNVSFTHSPQSEPLPRITLLKTGCSDCLLVQPPNRMFTTQSDSISLQLLSKRRTVTAVELEEFKKQAECLNLTQPFTLDPEGGLCPELSSQDTKNIDVPRWFLNGKLFNFENFIENITDRISGDKNV